MLDLSRRLHSLPKRPDHPQPDQVQAGIDVGIEILAFEKPLGEVAIQLLHEHVDELAFQPGDFWDVVKLGRTQLYMMAQVELVVCKSRSVWSGPTRRFGFVRKAR
jgi:hypothetical protein